MNRYRQSLLKVNGIMDRVKSDRERITKSGLQDWKIKEDMKALGERASLELRLFGDELQEIANLYVSEGKKMADGIRRKGKDTSLMSYHQARARDSFGGLNSDQMLSKLDKLAGVLQDDEKEYLYVYEDTLKAMINDPVYDMAIDETLNKYRGELEKAALNEVARRENFLNHDKTLRGLAEMEVKSILDGDKPAGHDFAELLDEMS